MRLVWGVGRCSSRLLTTNKPNTHACAGGGRLHACTTAAALGLRPSPFFFFCFFLSFKKEETLVLAAPGSGLSLLSRG